MVVSVFLHDGVFILWIFIYSFIIVFSLISLSILTTKQISYVLVLCQIVANFLTIFYASFKTFLGGRLSDAGVSNFYLDMGLGYALIHNFVVFSLHGIFIFIEKFTVDLKVQKSVAVNAYVRNFLNVFLGYVHVWIFILMYDGQILDFVSYYQCLVNILMSCQYFSYGHDIRACSFSIVCITFYLRFFMFCKCFYAIFLWVNLLG